MKLFSVLTALAFLLGLAAGVPLAQSLDSRGCVLVITGADMARLMIPTFFMGCLWAVVVMKGFFK